MIALNSNLTEHYLLLKVRGGVMCDYFPQFGVSL
jgi:hypothetical protein